MRDSNRIYLDHHMQTQPGDEDAASKERNIAVAVPGKLSREEYSVAGPHPEVYRQALQVMLGTPEIENRLNYITAGMIVTIFGSWLAGRVVKSRTFVAFTDILLIFFSAALGGGLVGLLLAQGFISGEIVPVLLFAAAGIAFLVPGVVLVSLLLGSTPGARERSDRTPKRGTVLQGHLE